MGYSIENLFGKLEVNGGEDSDDAEELPSKPRIALGDLSDDQKAAYDQVYDWIADPTGRPILTLGGFAGTGKTTLISLVVRSAGHVACCAYTGKAANVLRQKLRLQGVRPEYCGTIHRLIYRPMVDEKGTLKGWEQVEELDYDLIVVDEASMVDEELFEHLQSYGIPILAVGDHGQLPPVKGSFNLMSNPVIKLERIHRQAQDNPIIRLSEQIRHNGGSAIPYGNVFGIRDISMHFVGLFKQAPLRTGILCFTNKKRCNLNSTLRGAVIDTQSAKEVIAKDEVVVCLKNTRFGMEYVFNGMRGVVGEVGGTYRVQFGLDSFEEDQVHKATERVRAEVLFPDDRLLLHGRINKFQFGRDKTISSFEELGLPEKTAWPDLGMLFDYGYAMTCHKAQGSEFDTVGVVLENMSYVDEDYRRRWLYTAITRASQNLYLIRP